MTKKQRALEVIKRLKEEYPKTQCTLDYDEAWKLLVSVRLAAQCTDERVNVIVAKLFEKYSSVDSLAAANVEDIESIVRPCGLGKSKARDISACMKIIRDEYEGPLTKPCLMKFLTSNYKGKMDMKVASGVVTELVTPKKPEVEVDTICFVCGNSASE